MVRLEAKPPGGTHACSTVAGATRWTARPSPWARPWCVRGSPPTSSPSSVWPCRWSRPWPWDRAISSLGILLLFPTGLPDLFDGPVAKASGRASVRGAFFDSVADRISDAFLFGGVAWYLAAHHHGEMVLLPFAILAVTSLISYQRAKAELLGLSAKGGLMERAERFILLGPVLHRRRRLGRRLRSRPVGVLRAAVCHRHRALRQRLEGGRGPSAAGVGPGRAGRGRHGRDAPGPGPLARGTGGLALADLARGSRRIATPSARAPRCRAGPRSRRAGGGRGVPGCRRVGRVASGVPVARPGPRAQRTPTRVARLLSPPPRSDLRRRPETCPTRPTTGPEPGSDRTVRPRRRRRRRRRRMGRLPDLPRRSARPCRSCPSAWPPPRPRRWRLVLSQVQRRGRGACTSATCAGCSGPGVSDAEVRPRTRRAFLNYARYWFEGARLPAVEPRGRRPTASWSRAGGSISWRAWRRATA